jgi:hypothetical protein
MIRAALEMVAFLGVLAVLAVWCFIIGPAVLEPAPAHAPVVAAIDGN